MVNIDVDWDVWRAITARRETETMTPNDVLRDQFKLPRPKVAQRSAAPGAWYYAGVSWPNGTEFRAEYGGKEHRMAVEDEKLMFNGKRVYSPSATAREICGYARNGWHFWQFRMPGDAGWRWMNQMRQHELTAADAGLA